MTNFSEKVYRMFILGTSGDEYKTALTKGLGGIIFFTHDIQSKNQFKALINEVKSYSPLKNLFLSIDQEGGRVERTENIHNGKKYLSAKYAYQKGEDFLKAQTEDIADELTSYGINLNFAPCIDVNTNPNNPIIGERAFSDNTDNVIKGEAIVSKVYRQKKIIPCLKHYPGHGDANSDSHLTLPEIDLPMFEMERTHIKPFRICSKDAEMIMVAHLHCKCFEPNNKLPCSLSKNAISYLRNSLGFRGITISDDMVMKGVSNFGNLSQVDICELGIKAGLNMFIYRNSDSETIKIIEEIINRAKKDNYLSKKINESYDIIERVMNSFFS